MIYRGVVVDEGRCLEQRGGVLGVDVDVDVFSSILWARVTLPTVTRHHQDPLRQASQTVSKVF